jgi:hypothetical protein
MVRIPSAEKTPPASASFHEHAIAAGIGTPVCHTMLNDVDIHSRSKPSVEILTSRSLDNFVDRKIHLLRMLAV